jgi:UDP-N-acetylmuramoyl-L-alanyl-D-glutamate--2,6-diaminopimelate ligase
VAGRGAAIAQLIAAADARDVIVLAGKGHEDYQEINGERLPFSDLEEAAKALDAWEAAHA